MDSISDKADKAVLLRLTLGDEKAFETVFQQYRQMVYNVAWTYTESQPLSEEILQDVFIICWNHRSRLPEIADLSAWLYVIAKNRSLRVLKQLNKLKQNENSAASYNTLIEEDHTRQYSEQQIQQLLAAALNTLSPQQRKVFELSRIQGLSREQVAVTMGISRSTVSVHLTIALRLVRAHLVVHLELPLVIILLSKHL